MGDDASLPLIEASRCSSCGEFIIPSRELCPYCRAHMGRTAVERWGNVLSWTTVHITPEGFSAPRTVALVRLECGAMILCLVPGGSEPVMEARVSVIVENGSFMMNDHRLKPVVSIRSEPLGFHRLKAVVSSRMK